MDTSVAGSRYPIGAPEAAQSSWTSRRLPIGTAEDWQPGSADGRRRSQRGGREADGFSSLERWQVSHEHSTSSHGTPSAWASLQHPLCFHRIRVEGFSSDDSD
jgi:hypothetical protein